MLFYHKTMKPLKAVDAESAVRETADTWENRLKVREIESSDGGACPFSEMDG